MISLFKYKLFCSHLITLIGEVRNRSEKLNKKCGEREGIYRRNHHFVTFGHSSPAYI